MKKIYFYKIIFFIYIYMNINNNTSKNKKDIKLNDLNKIIQDLMNKNEKYERNLELIKDLMNKNEKYERNLELINYRLFGKNDELNRLNDINYGNVSDEVQRLNIIVKNFVYNNEEDYYKNSRGPQWGKDGYIEKIKKRVKELKKNTKNTKKNTNNSNEPPTWQSDY